MSDAGLPRAQLLPWHAAVWHQIAQRRLDRRMPHALLLAGPEGLGKVGFAAYLAQALICTNPGPDAAPCGRCQACHLVDGGSHPDLHWIRPDEAGKAIRVDAIRRLSARSVLAAGQDSYRVFLIAPADAMNRAAANALLKTLEEPVTGTVLILISSYPERLSATIRSRCQVLRCALPSAAEVRTWLGDSMPDDQIDALYAIAGGVPLRMRLARDEDWVGVASRLHGQLADLKARRVNPMQISKDWAARGPIALLVDLRRCIADMVCLAAAGPMSRLYHPDARETLQKLREGIDLMAMYGFLDRINELTRQQAHNLNPQMLIDRIVLDWLQITRPGGH